MIENATQSLRKHPDLQDIWMNCQNRHLDDDEIELYTSIVPEHASRAEAAREIADVTDPVVRKVIKRIFEVYPYEKNHDMASTKSVRDTRLVVYYATVAMLMGDPHWFSNKLLYWLKCILQSFRFPEIAPGAKRIFHRDPEAMAVIEKLRPHQRSIYETFHLLEVEMRKALSEEAYEEIEPYLAQATQILSHD